MALVVGAGDATGAAVARRLAREHLTVVCVRRNADALAELVGTIERNWMKHSLTWRDEKTGKTTVGYRPTHQNSLDDKEQKPFPPQARVD